MSEEIRMQIAVLIILFYLAINYFSAKRNKTIVHDLFSLMIVVAIINVVFDLAYMLSINTNFWAKLMSKGYMISMMGFHTVLCCYIFAVGKERGERLPFKKSIFLQVPFLLFVPLALFLPARHFVGYGWKEDTGLSFYIFVVFGALYLIADAVLTVTAWERITAKDRIIGIVTFSALWGIMIYQIFNPQMLVTSFGIVLSVMVIFLLMESPDSLLIEKLQIERDRAQKANQSKSSFVAHISHEVRTPINAIIGMNEIISRETLEENTKRYSSDMAVSAYNLYGIINDVLEMSQIESGKMEMLPERYSLNALIQDSVDKVREKARAKKLDLFVDVKPSIPSMYYGDDRNIKQILVYLLENAVSFTHEGFVRLAIDGEFEGDFMKLKFQVIDSGMGIREEDLNNIVESFGSYGDSAGNTIQGIGLGMSITNNLLKMMGSFLEVSSVLGEGSVFSFSLIQRIISREAIGDFNEYSGKMASNDKIDFTAPSVKLLVVDDSSINRKVFSSLLKGSEIVVREASSAYECLEMIKNEQYDIIFLDNLMDGMNGFECLEHMKKDRDHLNRLTPVVMLTANSLSVIQDEYSKAGFDSYLSKPIFCNELVKLIRAFVAPYKLQNNEQDKKEEAKEAANWKDELPMIKGIDWEIALKHLPQKEILYATIREFKKSIQKDAKRMDECIADITDPEKLDSFRIRVHALKSSANMIGAHMLSEGALEMEQAAKNRDFSLIREKYRYMINYYRSFDQRLYVFDEGEDGKKKEIDFSQVIALVEMVQLEMEEMNKEGAFESLEEIEEYEFPEEIYNNIIRLKNAVTDFNLSEIATITGKIKEQLRNLRNSIKESNNIQ